MRSSLSPQSCGPSGHAGRSPGRTGPPRIPRALSRPRGGPPDQVRSDLQESRRTGRRLLFAPALSNHRDPDRAPPDPRGDGGHACARGAAGGRVLVLRNPSTRTGLRTACCRGKRSVRRLEPFAARFQFETWLLPKVHARAFETLSDSDRPALARILKDVLGRMDRLVDDPSFNYYIHTAPVREPEGTFHLHLGITPRLTEIAGFERGTGFYINPVVP